MVEGIECRKKCINWDAMFGIILQEVRNALRHVEKMMEEDNRFSSQAIRLKEKVGIYVK